MRKSWIIGCMLLLAIGMQAAKADRPHKGLHFFYRSGNWVDNYLLQKVDTDYIVLPEHSWSVAFTSGMMHLI